MKLIINADDYGFDENRTRAIQCAFREKFVTQTTIMTNMPWFERAMDEAREFGFADKVGLHLNLTEGVPLTEPIRNCRLVCPNGREMSSSYHTKYLNRFWLPKEVAYAISVEARAQMERYIAYGGTMMHLDSHHHVHTDISVARVVIPLAKSLGFKTIRMSRTIGDEISLTRRVYKSIINSFLGRNLSFVSSEFCSFPDLMKHVREIDQDSSVEVMVHPLYGETHRLDMRGPFSDAKMPISEEQKFLKAL